MKAILDVHSIFRDVNNKGFLRNSQKMTAFVVLVAVKAKLANTHNPNLSLFTKVCLVIRVTCLYKRTYPKITLFPLLCKNRTALVIPCPHLPSPLTNKVLLGALFTSHLFLIPVGWGSRWLGDNGPHSLPA